MTTTGITRPAEDEYDSYYGGYIERIEGPRVVEALEGQLAETLELLSGLSDDQACHRYAPEKWSVKEVFGHLMDTERVFLYRALCCARGERQSQPGFDQDEYVVTGKFDQRSVASLAHEYEAVRHGTLAFCANLQPSAWPQRGIANNASISVRALVFIIAGHEAHHLEILRQRYL